MNSPLAIFLTIWLTVFFGFSWVLLVGHWLGLSTFSSERYIVAELLPLAYGLAPLSIIFLVAIIAAKVHYR